MRAILIDPVEQTITEVEYDGDYRQIYKLINADMFDCVRLGNEGETLYVDDEGRLKPNHYFVIDGQDLQYHSILAGKGLILGTDPDGDTIDTKLTVNFIQSNIRFLGHVAVGTV